MIHKLHTMRKYLLFFLLISGNQSFAQYNANGQQIKTPAGTLNNASAFTVEFWVQTADNRSNNIYWQRPTLFGNETNGDNSGDFGIILNNGYIGMWEGISNLNADQNFLSNSVRINDNFWHHIAAVNNGQMLNLYVDGNIVGSLVTGRSLRTFNAPLTFGAASLDHNFPGNLNSTNFSSQSSFGDARISNSVRYGSNFRPENSFISDGSTVGLYRFANGGNTNYTANNNYPNNNNVNVAISMDPNHPVTLQEGQAINTDYAQQATLFINDSVVLYGKLLLAKKNWSFNNEVGIHFWEGSSKKDHFYKTTEIKGFKMGDNYFEPGLLSQGGPVSVPLNPAIVRRITPEGSKMNMYEYIASIKNTNQFGANYTNTTVYLVGLPHSASGDKLYQFSDNKFVPHFDTRVSSFVADNPALADKIRSKDKDYFYAFVTEADHQYKVWWNIITEYNK